MQFKTIEIIKPGSWEIMKSGKQFKFQYYELGNINLGIVNRKLEIGNWKLG